jgi:hypothetical protein
MDASSLPQAELGVAIGWPRGRFGPDHAWPRVSVSSTLEGTGLDNLMRPIYGSRNWFRPTTTLPQPREAVA